MNKKICIRKENIRPLLERLSERGQIYLPVRDSETGIIDFADLNVLKDSDNLSADFNEKTKKSPKSVVFPSTETLLEFEYKKDINKPEITQISLLEKSGNEAGTEKTGKKIIFGLKPCDTIGFKSFDLVFNEKGREDKYYNEKRLDTVLVSIGCSTIFPDCFCLSVGGNPFNFDYSDIGLVDTGDLLVIMKKSENGAIAEILETGKEFLEEREFDESGLKVIDDIILGSKSRQQKLLEEAGLPEIDKDSIEKILESNFSNEDVWKEISQKCVSCGACTYVCPTCVCFNIGDEVRDLEGERYRCWDFCTNYYYTLEASGHNPRGKIFQRYRNKINCKFNYFHKRKKILYCTGCGRCVDVCSVGMDIREIIRKVLMLEKSKETPLSVR